MQVTVRQRGGVMGIDRVTELDDAVARRVDAGEVTAERVVDPEAEARLRELVDRASAIDPGTLPEPAGGSIDAVDLEVEISAGPETWACRYTDATEVPAALAELVRTVVAAPYRDVAT